MKVRIELEVWTKTEDEYRERGNKLFDVIIEEGSAKQAEEKIGLLSQAMTHMGWRIK